MHTIGGNSMLNHKNHVSLGLTHGHKVYWDKQGLKLPYSSLNICHASQAVCLISDGRL